MTSLQSSWKQVDTRAGYYVNVGKVSGAGATAVTFYYNAGTDNVPLISTNPWALSTNTSTILNTVGSAVFRDHGKTLVSSGRVFRKVQLLLGTGNVYPGNGSDGVSGGSVAGADGVQPSYLTGLIELPGQSTGSGTATFTPVARLG
jgi:hypothetical protein